MEARSFTGYRIEKHSERVTPGSTRPLPWQALPSTRFLYGAIVDADTTALITYGSQEDTAAGWIPKRRHAQASYAPLIASEGRSGLSWGIELRRGSVPPSIEGCATRPSSILYPPLKKRMVEAGYHEFGRGLEGAEFTYTRFHWNAEHRFVAVRRSTAVETEENQRRLFTFKQYTYHRGLVTNLDLTPPAVWRFDCDRADG